MIALNNNIEYIGERVQNDLEVTAGEHVLKFETQRSANNYFEKLCKTFQKIIFVLTDTMMYTCNICIEYSNDIVL